MCSNWIINGRFCESGADLVSALGDKDARYVNRGYDDLGKPARRKGREGMEDFTTTESNVLANCLCGVDHERMAEITGSEWGYDPEQDAFTTAHSEKGEE